MTKRKQEIIAEATSADVPPPAAETPPRSAAELPQRATEMRLWREGSWKGFRQLCCNLCPWDTLDGEEAMLEHIRARHLPAAAPQPTVQLYDARGRAIQR